VRPLFISGTGTGVGKTYATLLLINVFAELKIRVGVCKPVETGVKKSPKDAEILLNACQDVNSSFQKLKPHEICAYTLQIPAAPYCADISAKISLDRIFDKISQLADMCDLLLIEGAGGLMVPILKDYFMIDLSQDTASHTLLVTSSRLGCINETLLSLEALKQRNMKHDWCVNLYEDSKNFPLITQPFYDSVMPDWWSLTKGLEQFAKNYLDLYR
jgi:dethiobiotin synthetase